MLNFWVRTRYTLTRLPSLKTTHSQLYATPYSIYMQLPYIFESDFFIRDDSEMLDMAI